MRQRRVMASLYPEPVRQPLCWWEVLIGAVIFALIGFAVVWAFAVLAAVVRGEP